MTDLGFSITGDRRVQLRFEQFPRLLHDRLLAAITDVTARLEAAVIGATPRRTGKLAGEIVSRVFDNAEDRIRGRVTVSAEFAKAAALEYGAHGSAKVAAHAMRLDHVFANRLAAPLAVMVQAHSRILDIAERRFLRGPLAAMEPEIVAELNQAVAGAVEAP